MDEYNKDQMPDEQIDHIENPGTDNIVNKEIGPDENMEYDYARSESQTQSEAGAEEENADQTQTDEKNNKFAYQDNHYEYENKNTQYNSEQTPMDLKDWVLTLVILMIPCVGIVMYFVWAFGNKGNINRRNFCRAQLIIFGVLLVIYLVFFALFGAVMTKAFIAY